MQTTLVITSSLNGANGNSNKLVATYLEHVNKQAIKLDLLDVDELNLPHLTQTEMAAWMTPEAERSDEQKRLAATSDELIERVKNADKIVIGLPMYNLGVPSTFKAFIDRIARAGKTFKYTETGPAGLVEDKPVLILAARGGVYAGTDFDTQTPYIKSIFGLMGITQCEFIYAEGLNMGPEAAESAFSSANKKIIELLDNSAD